jgi:hypothetical protein
MNNILGLEEENKGKDSRLIYFGVIGFIFEG